MNMFLVCLIYKAQYIKKKILPWMAAACSRNMKSAGLGGGVLENFGDFGSEKRKN